MTIVKKQSHEDYLDHLCRKRAIYDLRQNAQRKLTNYAEKGFYQKHIDLLYQLGYYKDNKSIFDGESEE